MFWKIEESTGRYYFTHDPIYTTREEAEKALATIANGRCRVAAYRQGGIGEHGAQRIEPQPDREPRTLHDATYYGIRLDADQVED